MNNFDEIWYYDDPETESRLYTILSVDGRPVLYEYNTTVDPDDAEEEFFLDLSEYYESEEFEMYGEVTGFLNTTFRDNRYFRIMHVDRAITYIQEGTFCSCEDLTEIIVEEENPVYCSADGIMFNKDKTAILAVPPAKTGTVVIPDSVTAIAGYAFANCSRLTKIVIPASVTEIGEGAFVRCSRCALDFSGNSNFLIENGILSDKDKTRLISVYETAGDAFTVPDSFTRIENEAFVSCGKVTCINIHENVSHISCWALTGCEGLTKVNISENNPHYSCSDVIIYNKDKTEFAAVPDKAETAVVIPESISSIGSRLCSTDFTEISLPNSIKELNYDPFYRCNNLHTITFYGASPDTYEDINGLSSPDLADLKNLYCHSLVNITLPDVTANFNAGKFPFLENIFVSENNSSLSSADGVLYDKKKERLIAVPRKRTGEFVVPDGVKYISPSAFLGCEHITGIVLPDSIEEIGEGAFEECRTLKSINRPASLKITGEKIFPGCYMLPCKVLREFHGLPDKR